MVVVVGATAVESQVTLHVIVLVVGVPVTTDSMTVEAMVADQVSTHETVLLLLLLLVFNRNFF